MRPPGWAIQPHTGAACRVLSESRQHSPLLCIHVPSAHLQSWAENRAPESSPQSKYKCPHFVKRKTVCSEKTWHPLGLRMELINSRQIILFISQPIAHSQGYSECELYTQSSCVRFFHLLAVWLWVYYFTSEPHLSKWRCSCAHSSTRAMERSECNEATEELTWHNECSINARKTRQCKGSGQPSLPALSSSFEEMSTDLHRAVGHLGPPVLEVRFHYKPSMGTTNYTLVLIGFPWFGNEGGGGSDNNLGWFSCLSLGIYLTVIPVPKGQCHTPAPAASSPMITAHPWDSHLLAARDSSNVGSL